MGDARAWARTSRGGDALGAKALIGRWGGEGGWRDFLGEMGMRVKVTNITALYLKM